MHIHIVLQHLTSDVPVCGMSISGYWSDNAEEPLNKCNIIIIYDLIKSITIKVNYLFLDYYNDIFESLSINLIYHIKTSSCDTQVLKPLQ